MVWQQAPKFNAWEVSEPRRNQGSDGHEPARVEPQPHHGGDPDGENRILLSVRGVAPPFLPTIAVKTPSLLLHAQLISPVDNTDRHFIFSGPSPIRFSHQLYS